MSHPAEQLRELSSHGLLRALRPLESPPGVQIVREGKTLWNFASNDYLGLAGHSSIRDAFIEGVRLHGTGATASRLVCGSLGAHHLLEKAIASAKQAEAALTFTSGFTAALGAIPAIVGKNDTVILDKLCHASLVDAARLSGATLRVFPHNHLDKLDRLLAFARAKSPSATLLVVTESIFSMDGDLCPLREILDLTEAHGALLFLDEAHAVGVLGETGMGLAEALGLQHRVTFQMGTFSKAIGLSGGYIAASRPWIDLLVNRARSLIYTTAPPPAIAHAALTALDIVTSSEGRHLRQTLVRNLEILSSTPHSPIFPLILGSNESALAASRDLEAAGFLVPAIRYPTVPRGTARLRVSLSAAHPPDAILHLRSLLSAAKKPSGTT